MKKNGKIKQLVLDRSYRSYWLASTFSMTASNILQFVLALYIFDRTGSAMIYASLLAIVFIPRLLVTPVAGVLGDRFNKLEIIIICHTIDCIVLLIYGILAFHSQGLPLYSLYFLVVILELVEVFYQAPESAILPEIVRDDLLEEAVFLSKIDDGLVRVASPMLAAFLYGLVGLVGSLLVTGTMFLLGLIMVMQVKVSKKDEASSDAEGRHYWRDFVEGLQVLKKLPFIRRFLWIAPLINFSFASVFSISITYLFLEVYQVSELVLGLYRAVTSSMVILVPIFVLPVIKKSSTEDLIKRATFVIAICLAVIAGLVYFGEEGQEELRLVSMVCIAIFDCMTIAIIMPVHMSLSVYFQRNIPEKYRSRIMSVSSLLSLASIPLGNMFYGFLADRFPVWISVLFASLSIGLCYILSKCLFTNSRTRESATSNL